MKESFNKNLTQLESGDIDKVELALSSIVSEGNKEAIPYLLQTLRSTEDADIRNAIALALSDLQAHEAVAALLEIIKNPKHKGFTGTLLYALQNLDCKDYFLDFIHILGEGTFENSEMALGLIEKYADDVDYGVRLEAINTLKSFKKGQSPEFASSKYDNLHYIEHALKLLLDY